MVRNHLSTSRALLAGSSSFAGATKAVGCSHQYELNSVRLVEERMKGGAVREERSPLKEAMDYVADKKTSRVSDALDTTVEQESRQHKAKVKVGMASLTLRNEAQPDPVA